MEIRVLRYFLAAAKEENITRAAETLHITQPTLSRQLALLEEETGVTLFQRGARKITLTSEGLLLKSRAEEIVSLADKTMEELSVYDEVEGTIRIGTGGLHANHILFAAAERFRAENPKVHFSFFTSSADVIRERLDKGLIDIGVMMEPARLSDCEVIRLKEKEKWVVLLRFDDPLCSRESISCEDLQSHEIVMPGRENVRGIVSEWLNASKHPYTVSYYSTLSTTAAEAVYTTGAAAFMVDGSLPFTDETKLVKKELNPPLETEAVIAFRKYRPMMKAAEQFIAFLRCFACRE